MLSHCVCRGTRRRHRYGTRIVVSGVDLRTTRLKPTAAETLAHTDPIAGAATEPLHPADLGPATNC
jgi:hypothetical protein